MQFEHQIHQQHLMHDSKQMVLHQYSCLFNPIAPALICSMSEIGFVACPLPVKPTLIGKPSAASNIL